MTNNFIQFFFFNFYPALLTLLHFLPVLTRKAYLTIAAVVSVLGYIFVAIGGKSAQQLSYGFNILDKLESCPHENQIPYGDMVFSKKVSKVIDFRWQIWS